MAIAGPPLNRFLTTDWSAVASAADPAHPDHPNSIERLLLHYLPALKDFLVARYSISSDHAEDIVQGFALEKVLKRQILAQADQARGRFRTFLLNALCNFAISEFRRASAQRRIPQNALIPLHELDEQSGLGVADDQSAWEFDLAFTRQILTETVERFQRYCQKTGRQDFWEVFDGRILGPTLNDKPVLPYDVLVTRIGVRSPDQASNILMSAKRVFTRLLRSVVAEYAKDEAEIDEELALLRGMLNRVERSQS